MICSVKSRRTTIGHERSNEGVVEVKPVDQLHAGTLGEGDCLMACAASVLEIPLGTLPEITKDNEGEWWLVFDKAIRERGFRIAELMNDPPLAPLGYAIAIGPTQRFDGQENHACVALDGDVVHDPHPSRSGLAGIDYWLTFVPIARRPQRLVPQQAAPVL
jgi:hypothetical protein